MLKMFAHFQHVEPLKISFTLLRGESLGRLNQRDCNIIPYCHESKPPPRQQTHGLAESENFAMLKSLRIKIKACMEFQILPALLKYSLIIFSTFSFSPLCFICFFLSIGNTAKLK